MNANTKDALRAFVYEVIQFGYSVSSVSGTNALKDLAEKGTALIKRLDKDETIP